MLNEPGLKSWFKRESIFEKTKPVIKTYHNFGKDINPLSVVDLLTNRRLEWDQNLAIFKEITHISDDVSVIHCGLKSPNMFIQARDFVEKRIQFLENGMYYAYCSSVPDEVWPPAKSFVRADTIFAATIITIEDGDCVFYYISQNDLKVSTRLFESGTDNAKKNRPCRYQRR